MKLMLKKNILIVKKESTDPQFYNGGWGSGESKLLHHIKLALIKAGHDVIKKRMAKDGHMFGNDTTQYIRSRKIQKGKPYMMIYDGNYALRLLNEEWNEKGEITLTVERGVGE